MDCKKVPAYELVMKEEIPDVQSTGYLFEHKKSGARVMVLENQDDNKVFNIAFRTTPKDSTGVAHILEHSVLCGSKEFPNKDPFVELVKGSMNTFLNAMTFPDKTMYPLASCNDTDFANLMHVYLDAVFFPNIYQKEEIFRQEGWIYQIEKPEDDLTYNGVVYNEMKGAYSSPEDVLEQEIMTSLFPDTTYCNESGGNPEMIPDLSYEEFLDFHRTYYHPSNSYIYLYGNMDVAERMNWMDQAYLSKFDRKQVDSAIGHQKAFTSLAKVHKAYSIAQDDTLEDNTYLAYNTVMDTSLDTRLATAFAVLEYALLETPGAPLKQALLDAGIGKDIMSSYDSGVYQPVFSVIAKNANEADEDRFMAVIRETLEAQAAQGVDQNALRAAINIMEFKFREADYGGYPKGLMYGIDVFDSWLYDDSKPFDYLKQLADFTFLKEQVGTDYFETLIQTWMLDNQHASLVVIAPEKGLTAKLEEKTAEILKAKKEQLSETEIQELIQRYEALQKFQQTPSTQEELEKIPMLSRADMKKSAVPFSNHMTEWNGVPVVMHDYATNGIAYFTLLFDASAIAREDLPYLGILKSVIGMVDTANHTYGELYNEINQNTGGISPGISVYPNDKEPGRFRGAFGIQVRTLFDKVDYSFDMIDEMLFTSNLEQEKRLEEIIRKLESRTSSHLNSSGSATAAVRAMSYFSPVSMFNDCVSGVEFYKTVAEIEKHFEEKKEILKDKLKEVLAAVLKKSGMLLSFTGTETDLLKLQKSFVKLTDKIQEKTVEIAAEATTEKTSEKPSKAFKEDSHEAEVICRDIPTLPFFSEFPLEVKNEGFLTPAKIQYVAESGNFRQAGFEYTGSLRVLKVIMSYEYLWSKVRVEGGAYGCNTGFGHNGDTYFVSYRDPQLKKTLEVYDGIPQYLENFTVEERDMTKYVIGTIGELDTPLPPLTMGKRSLSALLGGLTEEDIQRERNEVLQASQEDIRKLAPMMQAVLNQKCICVLGNEERLKTDRDLFETLETL